uniref:Uncharacterized protein n=1 Tax=Knipowitschia caucasica TaxID=637954 RepID=A0AAV2J9T1_KNICA
MHRLSPRESAKPESRYPVDRARAPASISPLVCYQPSLAPPLRHSQSPLKYPARAHETHPRRGGRPPRFPLYPDPAARAHSFLSHVASISPTATLTRTFSRVPRLLISSPVRLYPSSRTLSIDPQPLFSTRGLRLTHQCSHPSRCSPRLSRCPEIIRVPTLSDVCLPAYRPISLLRLTLLPSLSSPQIASFLSPLSVSPLALTLALHALRSPLARAPAATASLPPERVVSSPTSRSLPSRSAPKSLAASSPRSILLRPSRLSPTRLPLCKSPILVSGSSHPVHSISPPEGAPASLPPLIRGPSILMSSPTRSAALPSTYSRPRAISHFLSRSLPLSPHRISSSETGIAPSTSPYSPSSRLLAFHLFSPPGSALTPQHRFYSCCLSFIGFCHVLIASPALTQLAGAKNPEDSARSV